jgi:dUTP pyrophosphatase
MAAPLIVEMTRVRPAQDADIPPPAYMTAMAAGMDLRAAVSEDRAVEPGRVALIPTGFAAAIPAGYEAQIRPRSGLAVHHGIGIINSPGTIDADYRGEIQVPLVNFSENVYTVRRGERIAQMVVQRVSRVRIEIVDRLSQTARGGGGFGHTGI